ncbi:MAG TPA: fibronectin type III domain-containing protein [Gaiellaceae bacterium]|nr:fibronectin type III domain-containing protein [Gaiellaceae bacterium]
MFFRRRALAAATLVLGAVVVVSTASAASHRRDRTPPTTPTNLRITATTDTTVTLAWNPSTDNSGNFSYRVNQRYFNDYTVAVPQTQTTITFTRLWPETTYSYFVYAVDAAGNRSGNSNTISYTVPRDVTPPTPAPQLTTTAISPARAGFSWTRSVDNVSQVKYTLYADGVQQAELFDYEHVTLWTLTPGTTYQFQVIARDVFGNATPGNTVSYTAPSTTDTTPPTAPTNLSGAEIENEIHMTWTQSTDDTDPQSVILYEFYLNGVMHPADDLFGSSGLVYCREASGFTTVVAKAVDSSGNRSGPSNAIIVQCP